MRFLGIGAGTCAVVAACGGDIVIEDGARAGDDEPAAAGDAGGDAGRPAEPAADASPTGRCDPTKELGAPVPVPGLNTAVDEWAVWLSADELTAYVTRADAGAAQASRVVVARRGARDDDFGGATVDASFAAVHQVYPQVTVLAMTAGELVAYVAGRTADGTFSLGVTQRSASSLPFDAPVAVSSFVGVQAANAFVDAQGEHLYAGGLPGPSIHRAKRVGAGPKAFSTPETLSQLGTPVHRPLVSADGKTLYFANLGASQRVLRATAPTSHGTFGAAAEVPSLSSASGTDTLATWISADDCVLYLSSSRGNGRRDIYVARRPM